MSIFDETIRLDPRAQDITIIRATNVESYMIAEATGIDAGRRRLDPFFDFEYMAKLPSDSNIVTGEIIKGSNDYFLVMATEGKMFEEALGFYKCNLYKCNSIISVYYFNQTTKKYDILHKSGIHCLITQVRAQEWDEDKTLVIRQYRGRQQPFQIFTKSDSGIIKDMGCILIDQDNRRFRVNKESDMFIASGISQCEILWES